MAQQRFVSCGFAHLAPNEGELREYSKEYAILARESLTGDLALKSPDMMRVVFEAVFRKMSVSPVFAGFEFPEHGIFHFRPKTGFTEEGCRAKYQVFQVILQHSGGPDYAYIVLDEHLPGMDPGRETARLRTYELRGITKPTPVAVPECSWFNNPENWDYWSELPQDFNLGIVAA